MSGGVKSFAPFESAQIQALIPLAKDIIARYDIKPQNVVAHADIAPQRKDDPGPRFPWRELAAQGLALGLTPSVWRFIWLDARRIRQSIPQRCLRYSRAMVMKSKPI